MEILLYGCRIHICRDALRGAVGNGIKCTAQAWTLSHVSKSPFFWTSNSYYSATVFLYGSCFCAKALQGTCGFFPIVKRQVSLPSPIFHNSSFSLETWNLPDRYLFKLRGKPVLHIRYLLIYSFAFKTKNLA